MLNSATQHAMLRKFNEIEFGERRVLTTYTLLFPLPTLRRVCRIQYEAKNLYQNYNIFNTNISPTVATMRENIKQCAKS